MQLAVKLSLPRTTGHGLALQKLLAAKRCNGETISLSSSQRVLLTSTLTCGHVGDNLRAFNCPRRPYYLQAGGLLPHHTSIPRYASPLQPQHKLRRIVFASIQAKTSNFAEFLLPYKQKLSQSGLFYQIIREQHAFGDEHRQKVVILGFVGIF